MKRFILSLVAAGALSVSAAQAVTVVSTLTDDVTIIGASVGDNINGDTFTFNWEITSGDASALVRFTLPGAAQISFDSYSGAGQQSGFYLFQEGGAGTDLTGGSPYSDSGAITDLATRNFILIGDTASAIAAGNILYDGITGTDAFVPGGTWVVGFIEGNGNPASGSASFTITAVPVPASGLLLLAAGGALAALRRRRKAA
jgi:hypothetical protein